MDIEPMNTTKLSNMIITPTFIWCFLMPLIHLFSLISNILCIVVFCSNTFIKRPIAIYFIGLLISDSITLLIGYIEMIDRESNMIDKSSLLCIFNGKIIHTITDIIYTFMGKFCLEWMLYKVLWTRASTILLSILSVQRSRTFFSLSYHESRLCAFFACVASVIIASTITCLEWTGVQYDQVTNNQIYYQIFQSIIEKKSSKDIYSNYLLRNLNESNNTYPCLINSINMTSLSTLNNQLNCSWNVTASEFYTFTRSLVSNRDQHVAETTANLLINPSLYESNSSNKSLLIKTIQTAKTPEVIGRLFEKRSCQIIIPYSIWLKLYDFLNSVSFTWSRRTVAIFFGNALPSFIVVLANLLSLKVIYFSKSLKYLKQASRKTRRKRRLQNDLRAFLVILVESFSIILISWAIPILLTMYHCGTLYVVNISTCPRIKDYLALFLFTDLFNSSTNCLLYSLSGILFRRKFVWVIKTILKCGRGTLWHVKQHLDRPPSNGHFFPKHSSAKPEKCCLTERLSSPIPNNQNRQMNYSSRPMPDDRSLSLGGRTSDDQPGGKNSSSENESISTKKSTETPIGKNSQTIKSYFMDKVRFFGTNNTHHRKSVNLPLTVMPSNKERVKSKTKLFNSILLKRQTANNLSISSCSFTGSVSQGSQCRRSFTNRKSSFKKTFQNNTIDNLLIPNHSIQENLTSV